MSTVSNFTVFGLRLRKEFTLANKVFQPGIKKNQEIYCELIDHLKFILENNYMTFMLENNYMSFLTT